MNKTITLLIIGVIFLALLLMVLNSVKTEEGRSVPVSTTEKVRPPENAPPAPAPADAESPPLVVPPPTNNASAPTQSDIAALGASTAGVAVKTVPAQIDSGQIPSSSPPPESPPPPPSPPPRTVQPKAPAAVEPSGKTTSGSTKNITNIVVYATQEGATLRLSGDTALAYKSMLLHNPERFVLDLEGQWNVTVPSIPSNKIIKGIRVGKQADSTRLVIDLHHAPASARVIKPTPQRIDVRLR